MNRRRELFEFTKHSHTCHDFTDHAVHTAGIEIERFYDHPGVNVFLRNLYQGDCLNYILSVLDAESLVHFGGGTHFDPCFKGRKQTDPRYTDDFTIQALVKADKKDVIFLEERNQ
jgi:hypothetical protein